MALFSKKNLSTLEDLFVEQIQDLYDAELRLVDALPKMAEAASSPELESAFRNHLSETKGQVNRLETVFQQLGRSAKRESCDAMKGLISEGEAIVEAKGDPSVKDAALIAAAQRVEHYEIAGYGAARSFAKQLGRSDLAGLLQQTLNEEGNADKKLTEIAETQANLEAAKAC
jgi:ferritin-like metal-binding protein YciE